MPFDRTYEELTSDEADFIISLYEAVSELVCSGRPVTLVALGRILDISTTELSDYLMEIVRIQDKVEEEYQIQQGRD
jgi:hypothetical protein